MSEATLNVILGAFMAVIGGIIAAPINALILRGLKRDEQFLQHRLDMIAKKRELLLQHSLEMERTKQDEISEIKNQIRRLQNDIDRLQGRTR